MKMKKDRILIGDETSPGRRTALRMRTEDPDTLEKGIFIEAKDGQPIPEGAEFIDVAEQDSDGWRDLDVIYSNKSGPAQVASPAYRAGHDRIFGKAQKVGIA